MTLQSYTYSTYFGEERKVDCSPCMLSKAGMKLLRISTQAARQSEKAWVAGYLIYCSPKINYFCSKLASAKIYCVYIVLLPLLLGFPTAICPLWLQEATFFYILGAPASSIAARVQCFVSSNHLLSKGSRVGRLFSLCHLPAKAARLRLNFFHFCFRSKAWKFFFFFFEVILSYFLLFKS